MIRLSVKALSSLRVFIGRTTCAEGTQKKSELEAVDES